MMSLSLSWTCQKDRVSLLVKFELKRKNSFKYCVDVENCESFRDLNKIQREIKIMCLKMINERESLSFFIIFYYFYIDYQRLSLSLSWTCQRDEVSLHVKF